MAQRLATEYVKASLQLSESQVDQFIQMFVEHHTELVVTTHVNGNRQMVFNDYGKPITLTFTRSGSVFSCEQSYRIKDPALANLMRKVMSTFKGDAIVNRIYPDFTMVYHYNHGSVVKITEVKDETERLVYEVKNTLLELQSLYDKGNIELEIEGIRQQINCWLDVRNEATNCENRKVIDQQLAFLAHQLFILEA